MAESHGVKGVDVLTLDEARGIKLQALLATSRIARALHTLADVLEDSGWIVRRDGDDIYVERKATDAEMNRWCAEGHARFEAILAGREARRRAWRIMATNAAREHGARVAKMTRRSGY